MTAETSRLLLKFLALIGLLVTGPVFGAAFGALHDQISFTVAPEYYTHFKFRQFGWADVGSMPPRLGAAVVGVLATWWVGLYAGVLLSLVALIHKTPSDMVRHTTRAYGLIALIAIAVGLIGLAYGWIEGRDAAAVATWLPDGLTSPRRFWAAGAMHDASYLGGAIGSIAAIGYQVRSRVLAARLADTRSVSQAPAV